MKLLRLTFLAQLSLLIFFAGCASQRVSYTCPVSPTVSSSSSPILVLKKKLDGMIARELLPYSVASIKVVSLKSGSTLYETNPSLLMPAASVQKLFTAAAVLSRLGPDHTIETSIAINPENTVLYLRGCGDPLLKTADLKHIASDLAGKLSLGRQYELVGDTGCFDDAYWGSGWMWDDEPALEAMYLSALSVNGNTITVKVSPGKAASSPMKVSTVPSTRYVVIENAGKTGKPGGPCSVSVTRPAGDRNNHIRVTGSLAPGCRSVSSRLTVWRPELYTLTLLAEQLKQAGIKAGPQTSGVEPSDAIKLTATQHPVGEIVTVMLKNSDNLSAENLLKYLAHTKSGQKGTAAKGEEVVKEYLRENGIPTDHLVIADGSGVSRYNLTNADTITRLLVAVYKDQAISPFFVNALPLAGRDGTLARRMKGTPAEGKVKAKTGTMKGVSALAGYTVTADGEPLAFSMIMQNYVGSD
ncbi:MAG: D-alanyl-D-alanine carboxypeptidase/D-alanyl-D-alanine-endopeptidase, partial [Geobacteraceae bacterium]|nr:D-alanyl-D-alanine carboxypeptidase/D-alanyl-D-alanine-endopeptidase [Geobacteraceae bacterium]